MDYSKVKYVKPSCDGRGFTQGKIYEFLIGHSNRDIKDGFGDVVDDKGRYQYIWIPNSIHLNGNHWIPCDENGKELGDN